jgi:hypothetical protein
LKCKVCSRETGPQSDFCEPHEKAYRNILQKFEVWKEALNIEWKEYLKEIAKNPLTGAWAKEVAESLLSNEA